MTAKTDIEKYGRMLALKNEAMTVPIAEFLAKYPADYGEVGILTDRDAARKLAFQRIHATASRFVYSQAIEGKLARGETITTRDILDARAAASASASVSLSTTRP